MDSITIAQPAHPTTPENEECSVRLRMHRVLKEAEERYRNELMSMDERELLRDRIIRLKKRLAATAS